MSSREHSFPPRLDVVLLHGLASTPKEFGLLVHPLRRRGVVLHAPQVHGYSHASLARPARWQDWVEAAGQAVRECTEGLDFYVLGGLCTGALLALALAARKADGALPGLALLSPTFAYDGWGLPWWYRFRTLAYALGLEERFAMRERPPYGLKNERLRQWVRHQIERDSDAETVVGPTSVSLQVVRESERMSAHAREWLARVKAPLLVLHARDDEICRLAQVESALADARPPQARLAVMENSYHMIAADNDRELVAEQLAEHAWACAGWKKETWTAPKH